MNLYEQIKLFLLCADDDVWHTRMSHVIECENAQVMNFSMAGHPFQTMYAICTQSEIVVVAIDHSWPLPCQAETATDHSASEQPAEWFGLKSSRPSPAASLSEVVKALKEEADTPGSDRVEVHGILITGSILRDFETLYYFWDGKGITVRDGAASPKPYLFADRIDIFTAPDTIKAVSAIGDPDDREPFESSEITDGINPTAIDEDDDDDEEDNDDVDLADDFPNPWSSEQPLNAQVLPCLENPERELEALVGLRSIKEHIQRLISLNDYNKKLRSIDPECPIHTINLHGCFLGGVGTGKTTVARLMGALFAKAGMLSKGHVVVADRRTFIGRQFGCEEENLQKCIKAAKGGVLLIDEAYLLVGNHHEDPGQMVIQMMLSLLADEKNRDIAVLLCGYEKEMQRIFDLNPGIVSRFPNVIKFPNYTLPELLEIARRRIKQYAYTFTPRAWQRFADVLSAKMKGNARNWANAREVANLLEQVYVQHAQRCCAQNVPAAAMHRITVADIPAYTPTVRPRLGF